jgi:hypothetical protein
MGKKKYYRHEFLSERKKERIFIYLLHATIVCYWTNRMT